MQGANGKLKPDFVMVNGREEKHAEGSYYLQFTDETGTRRLIAGGKTAAEAASKAAYEERRLKARIAAKEAGIPLPAGQNGTGRLLRAAVDEYLAEIKLTKKPKTHAAYKTALDYFMESCHKATLEEIRRADLLTFQAFLRDKKTLTPRSVYNKFESVMSFLKAQKITDLVQKNDWPRYTEEEVDVYEREELDKFFAACTQEEKLYFKFFLMTGMREQEVMCCTWRNVNFTKNIIAVRHNPEHGWTPKAYKEREIPVPMSLIGRLREWKKLTNGCPLIFPTGGCKPKFDFLDVCKAVAKRAGFCKELERWYLHHKFRATFCTWHLWNGVDLRTCQAWMGHSDLESTMRYLKPNHNDAVRAKVEGTFNANGAAAASAGSK